MLFFAMRNSIRRKKQQIVHKFEKRKLLSANLQTKSLLSRVAQDGEEPNNNNSLIQNANPKQMPATLSGLSPLAKTIDNSSSHFRTLHGPHRKLDAITSSSGTSGSGLSGSGSVSSAMNGPSSKSNLVQYELSQEMLDKRVELLQRKYGPKAWTATVLIQRFWRKRQMNQRFRNLALQATQTLLPSNSKTTEDNGLTVTSKANMQSDDTCRDHGEESAFDRSTTEPINMDLVDVGTSEIILADQSSIGMTQNSATSMLSGSGDSAISGMSGSSLKSGNSSGSFVGLTKSDVATSQPTTIVNKPILKRYSNASLHSNSSSGSSNSSICRSPTLPSLLHSPPPGSASSAGLLFGLLPSHPHLLYTASGQLMSAGNSGVGLHHHHHPLYSASSQMLNHNSNPLLHMHYSQTANIAHNHLQHSNTINPSSANGQQSMPTLQALPSNIPGYVQLVQANGQTIMQVPTSALLGNGGQTVTNNNSINSLPHSQCSQISLNNNCNQLSPSRSSICSASQFSLSPASSGGNISAISASLSSHNLATGISAAQLQPHLQLAQYEILRKRQYRVGLNLFNKQPPERGIQYLIDNGFIDANLLSYANASAFSDAALAALDTTDSTAADETLLADHREQQLAAAVAHFLLTRKGLSKQMIGEYLGNLQRPFNQQVLRYFVRQLDLGGLLVDVALRKFQTYFRFPGEAQKIERLVEVFAEKYYQCNFECGLHPVLANAYSGQQRSMTKDEIFILAFAIIMLNTDLHVPNNKRRMTPQQWLKNLKGVFKESGDLDETFLLQVYERIKQNEFKTGHDHCNHVLKVQQTLVSASSSKPVPNFCLTTYRRLVCFCRLYEIVDLNKKTTKAGQHQREVFLFNDMLLITKLAKSGTNPLGVGGSTSGQSSTGATTQNLYTYRRSILLSGCCVSLFSTNYYPFGIRITAAGGANNSGTNGTNINNNNNTQSSKPLIMFNARNDIDRKKFHEDLRESIAEITEMEMIRISAGSAGFASSFASSSSTSSCGSNGSNGRMVGSAALTGAFSPTHSLQSKSSSLLDLTNCPVSSIHSNGSLESCMYGKQSKVI